MSGALLLASMGREEEEVRFVKALSIWGLGDPEAGYWRLEGQERIAKIMNELCRFGGLVWVFVALRLTPSNGSLVCAVFSQPFII